MVFTAKILLFGEYGIVHGGSGLAFPYPDFWGALEFPSSSELHHEASESNQSIKKLHAYLLKNNDFFSALDLKQLAEDLERGLYFRSNIPGGAGLGSSGALVAALYQQYRTNEIDSPELIRNELGAIESYFHGSSSGTDPLVSYLNRTLLVHKERVELLPDWKISQTGLSVYLVDTGIRSKTVRLLDWFNAQMQNERFKQIARTDFFRHNEALIAAARRYELLEMNNLLSLSRYQMETMYPMVPETFRPHFFAGLEHGDFAFKLCGSGGGGFMLAFAYNSTVLDHYLLQNGLHFRRLD